MFHAESVEGAWAWIEQTYDRDGSDNLTPEGEYNLSEERVPQAEVDRLRSRCCGTGEQLFVIDGDLWLLAWSYGH